jgi:hypothetical protein
MSFGSLLRSVAPWYMANGRMGILLDSVGMTLDALAERSFLGRCAALVTSGGAKTPDGFVLQCEPDVLPWHANDRQIPIVPGESIASQRNALAHWHQLHAKRGTHRGELERIQSYFLGADGLGPLPRIRIVHQDGAGAAAMWHTISGFSDPDGAGIYSIHRELPSNFNFDGQTAKKSRYWGIVYRAGIPILNAQAIDWDDGSLWDGGGIWDGITATVANDIVSLFLSWKSAHSELAGVILTSDLTSFNPFALSTVLPDGSTSLPVGNWGHLTSGGLPTRPPYATWIYDLYH